MTFNFLVEGINLSPEMRNIILPPITEVVSKKLIFRKLYKICENIYF